MLFKVLSKIRFDTNNKIVKIKSRQKNHIQLLIFRFFYL